MSAIHFQLLLKVHLSGIRLYVYENNFSKNNDAPICLNVKTSLAGSSGRLCIHYCNGHSVCKEHEFSKIILLVAEHQFS